MPVFTALFAFFYLGEKLSKYDWAAVFIAFIGLLMIQNPFSQSVQTEEEKISFFDDMIGTSLAFSGSILGAIVGISIRIIAKQAKLHFMLVPMGFALGSVFLCPIFMTMRILYNPVDVASTVLTEPIYHHLSNGTVSVTPSQVGASLHVYTWWDVGMILMIAFFNFFQQIVQTLAYRYEKAGRVAPFLYL